MMKKVSFNNIAKIGTTVFLKPKVIFWAAFNY